MKIAVILPAAGSGTRFQQPGGASGNKIELVLGGKPVFLRAVELFLHRPGVVQVMVAVAPQRLQEFRFRWGDQLNFLGVTLVAGGKLERWETVARALESVVPEATHVAVHDAARPLAGQAMLDRVFQAAEQFPAVIPAVPVSATLKRVTAMASPQGKSDPLDALLGDAGKPVVAYRQVVGTVDRTDLVEVQTPQVFEIGLLRRAYAQVRDGRLADGTPVTDDAALVESLGQTVAVVEGESTNIKITRPEDWTLADALVQAREQKNAAAAAKKRLFSDEDD